MAQPRHGTGCSEGMPAHRGIPGWYRPIRISRGHRPLPEIPGGYRPLPGTLPPPTIVDAGPL
eukprot:1518454-Alexandrium_andersonii.AAC.1